jgi:hypothetical protein
MTRIRYTKVESIGNLVAGPFETADNKLTVNIDVDGLVSILNRENGIIYDDKAMASSIKYRTIPNAKKFAKKALQYLGVTIESEVRPRLKNKKGDCK